MSEAPESNKPSGGGVFGLRGALGALRSKVQKELDPQVAAEPAAQPASAGAVPPPIQPKIQLAPVRTATASEASTRFKKVLVLGGMDFFGAALVKRLNGAGFRNITIVDDLTDDRWKNFAPLSFDELQGFAEFDRNLSSRTRPVGVYSHIFYLADWRNGDSPMALAKSALALAAESNCRLISLASASSLGPSPDRSEVHRGAADSFRPECRTGLVSCLFDRYALSRLAPRNYLSLKHYRLFGSHERPDGALYGLAKVVYDNIVNGTVPRLPEALRPGSPEGDRKHDFLSVAYAAEMAVFLAENDSASGLYEIGSGSCATAWELIQAVFAALSRPVEVEWSQVVFTPPSPEPEMADLSRLRQLGWDKPLPSLADAVTQYVYSHYHGTEELPVVGRMEPEESKASPGGITKAFPMRRKPFVPKAS